MTAGPRGRGEHPSGRGAPVVGVVAEQLLRPVPGGIGRYVRALVEHLPAEAAVDGGVVRFVVCRHPAERLAAAGLPAADTRRLRWPGRLATRTWVTLHRPRLPAGLLGALDLVHATSAAVPPGAMLSRRKSSWRGGSTVSCSRARFSGEGSAW